MYLISKLYQDGLVSGKEAADMLGITKEEFLENLAKYNVSYFSDSLEDLHSDIANA